MKLLRIALVLLCMSAAISCSSVPTPILGQNGQPKNAFLLGGKGDLSYTPVAGTTNGYAMSYTYSNEKSFQHATQAVTTLAATGFAAWGAQAAKQSDNAAATAQQANTLNAQTTQAKNAADAASAQAATAAQAAATAGKQANFGKLIDKGTFATGQALPTPKVTQ